MKVFGFDFGDEAPQEHELHSSSSHDDATSTGRSARQPAPSSQSPHVGSDFDAGVVPDLHKDCGEEAAGRLGIGYVPGVGPILRSTQQAIDYCKATDQAPAALSRVIEEPLKRKGCGFQSKKTRKRVVFDGYDAAAFKGKMRRDMREVRHDAAKYQADMKAEHEARRQAQKATKRTIYSFPS